MRHGPSVSHSFITNHLYVNNSTTQITPSNKMALDCMDSSNYVSKILSERRKAKKPLMEKMRRARINDSLNELKTLVLDLLNKDASRYSKMEKADILEMTVSYLRATHRSDLRTQEMKSLAEFSAGFNQCASEVSKNLTTTPNTDHLREKLMSHLATSCHGNHPSSTFATTTFPATSSGGAPTVWVPYPSPPPSPTSQNTMYLKNAVPVHHEVVAPISPVSPVQLVPQTSFTQSLNENTSKCQSTKKPALWRPW